MMRKNKVYRLSFLLFIAFAMFGFAVSRVNAVSGGVCTLSGPADGASQTSMTVAFTFTPVSTGASYLTACNLWTNATGVGALTQANTTLMTNNSLNTISYTFTFTTRTVVNWNVQVVNNESDVAFDLAGNRTVTVGTYLSTYNAGVQTILSVALPTFYLIGAGITFITQRVKMTHITLIEAAVGFIFVGIVFPLAMSALLS